MKLHIKFFEQNSEAVVDCDSAETTHRDYPNTLVVRIVKSDVRTILRCYPLKNIEYYYAES